MEDTCREIFHFGKLGIAISESRRRSGIFMVKVLRMIKTIHLEEDAWQQSMPSGKDRQEVVDRCLDHRDIGDPGDEVFMYFGIANRETPDKWEPAVSRLEKEESFVVWGPAVNQSGFRESGIAGTRSPCIVKL
jgi:hypothetical protein